MEIFEDLTNQGLELETKLQTLIKGSEEYWPLMDTDLLESLLVGYHKWITIIIQSLESNYVDPIEVSFFKEPDNIPGQKIMYTPGYRSGSEATLDLAKSILSETKKKTERIREIARLVLRARQYKKSSGSQSELAPVTVGPLSYGEDGAIRYKGEIIKMRSQLRNLCVLFMEHHKKVVDYSTIKDEIISSKKRPHIEYTTIPKYVNALHVLLRKYFKKEVISNVKNEGYIFDVGK